MGLINHYYFFRLRDEIGAGEFHAKLSLFSPGDPGYIEDVSGAAILKSSQHQAAAAAVPRVPDQPGRPTRARGPVSFEYPLARASRPTRRCRHSASTSRTRSPPRRSETGLDARDLLRQAGLI